MDMLFDPYADGPFRAASEPGRATKSRLPDRPRRDRCGGRHRPGRQRQPPARHGRPGAGRQPALPGLRATDRPVLPSSASELLQGLNPQQEEAVKHAGSALLIVAGAGSGKTRVLSHRIAYLIATGRAHHGEILAITFTNKAAAEMRERIEALVGDRAKTMWISTFHSSCVRILRREAENVGLNSNFSIYDSADSLRLITLVAKNLDLDPKKFAPKAIQHKISALKNELIDDDSFASSANYNDPFEQAVADVFKGYTQRLRQANAMDFDDLIAETVYMFRAFPALADSYRRRFRHVLVDEYQDTNHAQYALVREIVGEGPGAAELTVVGDSDQSIYAFRGADIRNIVEFEKDYPDARTIKLEQNYRSTQTILSAANSVISRNPNRPGEAALDGGGRRREDHRLRRRERARRSPVHRQGNRPAAGRGQPPPRRRRHLLPHQRPVPLHRGRPGARGAAVQGGRRHPVLRAQGNQGRPRLPAGAGQPGRRRQPPPDPQRTQARHRRPGRGRRGRPRRSGTGPPSWPPPAAPRRRPAWPPAPSTRCWAS